ncbi:hypothetical protein PVAP13_4NG193200 [Panicum virgatum]|uniref:Uncharacterized protein n=1 Tax=Panicum virgatum TaxID=38727 RepID=A0A8T0TBP7_PANVG|nr:hypothetical protein PVAP13_4NG193200 [Panicum virgatum]
MAEPATLLARARATGAPSTHPSFVARPWRSRSPSHAPFAVWGGGGGRTGGRTGDDGEKARDGSLRRIQQRLWRACGGRDGAAGGGEAGGRCRGGSVRAGGREAGPRRRWRSFATLLDLALRESYGKIPFALEVPAVGGRYATPSWMELCRTG